ncbi:MAG TPA: prolyl oligopeptidase family serine peptidase [Archangium sp.]
MKRLLALLLLSACGGALPVKPAVPHAGVRDAGIVDAGVSVTEDAGVTETDAGGITEPFDAGPPRCTVTDTAITCTPRIDRVESRDVYWQTPALRPPAAGFPAVIVFQGSLYAPSSTWNTVQVTAAYGGYQQARMQALLLERGFTVIAPSALNGFAWQTNTTFDWDASSDKAFIDAVLAKMRAGDFGPIDTTRLYATGISSGGYMTSRMALSWPGVFRALAIHSASWATCGGTFCAVPTTMPAGHPPTRFLHGRLDLTVPLYTAEPYEQRLRAQGFQADLIVNDSAGHEWLAVSPERITEWFESH